MGVFYQAKMNDINVDQISHIKCREDDTYVIVMTNGKIIEEIFSSKEIDDIHDFIATSPENTENLK